MIVKKVSSVNLNVEDENTSFLRMRSRMNDSTLYLGTINAKEKDLIIDIDRLKIYKYTIKDKPINMCIEDKEVEDIILDMNDKYMLLQEKVGVLDKELSNRNKDFSDVTARFAKLIYKVHRLKGFWSRFKFLFTGTKGWKDEFKELNS